MPFFDYLMASFPTDLQPPEPLVRYFRWVGSQGLGVEDRYALIDPSQNQSCVVLVPVEPWLQDVDPTTADRLAPFCRTGGDGSLAALWSDDAGEIRVVHLGSGSGSVMVGVLAWNAIDFLRLLAIGYDELCWPEQHASTPMQAFIDNNGKPDEWDEDATPPIAPSALRRWLAQEFAVNVPETAAEIVGPMSRYGDGDSRDPFCRWLAKVQGS